MSWKRSAKKNKGNIAFFLKTNTNAVPRPIMGPKIMRREFKSKPKLKTINAKAANTHTKAAIKVHGCRRKFWGNESTDLANRYLDLFFVPPTINCAGVKNQLTATFLV